MSPSLYCSARRPAPLSPSEREAVHKIEAKYSVEARIKRFEETGQGIHWRPWHWLPEEEFSSADTILEGSVPLPCETEEALATAIDHWCNVVSALRREIHKALWEVRIGDREIQYDYRTDRYDPMK
jgi:hypothetical protein